MEEKDGKNLKCIGTGGNFLNRISMAYTIRSLMDRWDLITLQRFYKAKDTINRTKQQPTYLEKIFTNPT